MLPRRIALVCVAAMVVGSLLALDAIAGKGGNKGGGPKGNPEIACIRYKDDGGSRARFAVMVMDADGSNERAVVEVPFWGGTGAEIRSTAWSPDGSMLAFDRADWDDGSASGLYVVALDGGDPVLLSQFWPGLSLPAWSPDGSQIAYTRFPPYEIWVIDADGTNDTLLTSGQGPTWSPDGTELAFVRDAQVFVRDLASGTETNVTAGTPLDGLCLESVDWARTQDLLLVRAEGATYADIHVIDLGDPMNPVNITNTPGVMEWSASWSPDDSSIVFDRGGQDLYTIDYPGGTNETAIAVHGSKGKWAWSYHHPDWKR